MVSTNVDGTEKSAEPAGLFWGRIPCGSSGRVVDRLSADFADCRRT